MNWNDHYEYRDGQLYAKESINPRFPVGRKVGFTDRMGYVRTKLGSKMTFAHRVIWEMHNGVLPEASEIDHINGVKSDNRLENLRIVDRFLNCKNAKKRKDNTSGHTGICRRGVNWVVQIQVNNRRIAKTFTTQEEAIRYAESIYAEEKDFTERHGK